MADKTIPELIDATLSTSHYVPVAIDASTEATKASVSSVASFLDLTYFKNFASNLFRSFSSSVKVTGNLEAGTNNTIGSHNSHILSYNVVNADTFNYGFIGGGYGHTATSGPHYSAIVGGNGSTLFSCDRCGILGGYINYIGSDCDDSVIVGGLNNEINNDGDKSAIIGGVSGIITYSSNSSIFGGFQNTIGQDDNIVDSTYSVVLGGRNNIVQGGTNSIILGGKNNTVSGENTLAAGRLSKINSSHSGAMVLSDNTTTIDKYSWSPNSISFYFSSGLHVFDGNLYLETGLSSPTAETSYGHPGQFNISGQYLMISTGINRWGRVNLNWGQNSTAAGANPSYTTTYNIYTGVGTGLPTQEPDDLTIGDGVYRKVTFDASNNPRLVIPAAGVYSLDAMIPLAIGSLGTTHHLRMRNSTDNINISGASCFNHYEPTAVNKTHQVYLRGIHYFNAASKNIDVEYANLTDSAGGPDDVTYITPTGFSMSYTRLA